MRTLSILALLLLTACQTVQVRDFRDADDSREAATEESRLRLAAEKMDEQIRRSGRLYDDPRLEAYLQSIMDRLYPEFAGAIRVRPLDSPSLNAFAMANGSVYIGTGLIARLDNESQLATVLAHEAAHYVRRHTLKQRQATNATLTVATGVGAVTGLQGLTNLVAVSSIYGFSREYERDADAVGFKRLVEAGYDGREASRAFHHLRDEILALEISEPFFFSSHPRMAERILTFDELAKGLAEPTPGPGVDEFDDLAGGLRLDMLNDYLRMGRYQSVLLILERRDAFERYPQSAHYHRGEAYRLREGPGDTERAERAYRRAEEMAPEFAPTYRALGVQQMKRGKRAAARDYLQHYLKLAPEASDRDYVEQYLNRLGAGEGRDDR